MVSSARGGVTSVELSLAASELVAGDSGSARARAEQSDDTKIKAKAPVRTVTCSLLRTAAVCALTTVIDKNTELRHPRTEFRKPGCAHWAERGPFGKLRLAGQSVELQGRNVCASVESAPQAVQELSNFDGGGWLAIGSEPAALHPRSTKLGGSHEPPYLIGDGGTRAVGSRERSVAASIEFEPNLTPKGVQFFDPGLDGGLFDERPVRDQHDCHPSRKLEPFAHAADMLDGSGKIGTARRFPVARKREVLELSSLGGRIVF